MLLGDLCFRADILLGQSVETTSGEYPQRRVTVIEGGVFEGVSVSGSVLPGGGDWQTINRHGVVSIDARFLVEMREQTVAEVHCTGYRHGPPEVLRALGEGATIDPDSYYFRIVWRFSSAAPGDEWLARTLFVARAERRADRVIQHVYPVL